jgi:hypothetical protein
VCIFIYIPEFTGKESAGPVFGRDETQRTIRFCITRISQFAPLFGNSFFFAFL